MRDLSLHILDILDNCIAASATRIEVTVEQDIRRDMLDIEVSDNGAGMDGATLRRARDPFFTTRSGKRVGLGLPLFAQAAREAGGEFSIQSEPGRGTRVHASFRPSHPDCRPLGDMGRTIEVIRASHPGIRLDYRHSIVEEGERT